MATKKKAEKKSSGRSSSTPPSKRWSAKVTSDSTHPSKGLFNKSGKAIAEEMAKKSVSPKGPGQGIQMVSFYENRAGKNLPPKRKQSLETAKKLLRKKADATKTSAKKKSAKKSSAKKKRS